MILRSSTVFAAVSTAFRMGATQRTSTKGQSDDRRRRRNI